MTSAEPPKDDGELLEGTILTAERNRARDLGNSDRFQKCQNVSFFKAARREWRHGNGSSQVVDDEAFPDYAMPKKTIGRTKRRR